jgi:holo-[acyl-carrier protein] synthase
MALLGGARTRFLSMIPEGWDGRIHVTMTDDPPWAQAFVVIEALPPGHPEPGYPARG